MADKFKACGVDNCNKPALKLGYCSAHYFRLWRYGDPLGGSTPHGEPLRFIKEVALLHTGDKCLAWPYSKNTGGYGQISVGGKLVIVSRYVCELVRGAPPTPDHEAAHNCGNGHEGCIAPDHLEWKTHAENEADKIIHGTNNGRRPLMSEAFAIHAIGFFLAAVMLLSPVSSFAGKNDATWNPPARFDHAYSGKLMLTKIPQAKVQKACQWLFARYGLKDTTSFQQHGCAKSFPESCIVITIDNTYMGATPAAVLRHELGHCNLWPGDHPE